MGNHQSTSSIDTHLDHHSHATTARGSISKTMTRGKNFMRLGRKRLSGTWDMSISKLSSEGGGSNLLENEFSNIFPPAMTLERRCTVSADIVGLEGEFV